MGWFDRTEMKRELAYVLEGQSHLGESLGRTRSSHPETRVESLVSESFSCKRFKGSIVNGVIVYTRGKKSSVNLRNGFSENEKIEKLESSVEYAEESKSGAKPCTEEVLQGELVEVIIEDESKCHLDNCEVKEELVSGLPPTLKEGGTVEVPIQAADDCHRQRELSQVEFKRFTRSALKQKVEPINVDPSVNASEAMENEIISNLDGETSITIGSSAKNKMELKMSKKIELNSLIKKPTTVKELFDTGLVDGVSVIYMGNKKVCSGFLFVYIYWLYYFLLNYLATIET